MAEGIQTLETRSQARAWAAVWMGVAIVTLLAIHRLRDFPYHLSWLLAWGGIRPLLGETLWAAIKVWIFWGWSTAVLAGFALRIDPDLDHADALLAGAGGVWVCAYLLGNLIGPIGLFNTPTIWGLLALGTVSLWRNPPRFQVRAPTSGQKLAALAVLLLAVSYLPLQLGSPLVPFMDVLSYPSSVQRILTFGVYHPFNNDPYGCWGPYAQTPALELFYALLAFGSHTYVAALAESGAMLPMAALMIFATWRLGKTLFDDTAGGVASLFLFFTCLFRRAQGMRGTAVDFALVGLGLAFFMSRRSRALFAAGALMLGTAVASHAIDGALAMIVAGVGATLWLAESDHRRFGAGAVALVGAILMALPEFLIAFQHRAPYPIIPAVQLTGVVAIIVAAQWSTETAGFREQWLLTALSRSFIAVFVFAVFYRHASVPITLYQRIADNLPMLTLFCFGGLIAAFAAPWETAESQYSGLAAVALLLGIVGESLFPVLRALSHTPSAAMMASDVWIKLWDYWCPYFLTLPAGFLFALAYVRWSRPATMFVLLTLLIYPWHQNTKPAYYDSVEHSVAEQWAFNLHTAAVGYWTDYADRRWTFTPWEMNLIKVLNAEVASGRITPATHILHICKSISVWSMLQVPVLTGINDDPIEYQHDPNSLWEGGSRVRGMNEFAAALATRPPYMLEQTAPPSWVGDPPPGYQKIYDAGSVRLYRRTDLAELRRPANRRVIYSWIPGLIAFGAALFVAFGNGLSGRRAAD
ncbi:MAG TPA: hypothetical protein VJX23_15555 [Candidatus Binataceae bacterium]|nr:hypothetical protein [Candidatus Binataceae bacterium]